MDSHDELSTLQVPIVVARELSKESHDDSEAQIVDAPDEEHTCVPTEFVSVIVVKLRYAKEG